ncbi:MAG: hydroxypyruvate isomerase [SAR202 cluster bacterium]|nr:hydroxypyruvate isomerase [SAR202 cluster bacterium]
MNFAANLTMLFTEYDFLDRFEKAYKNNFKAVEYLFPYDYNPQELKNLLNEFNLKQALHNLPAGDWNNGERGIACHPDRIDEFKNGVDTAIEYAKTLNCNQLNCLIGIPPEGISEEELENLIIDNLKYASDKLKNEEIILLIEAINTIDIPGFYLNTTEQAKAIINKVKSDNIFIQYDAYHMQIMEGNLSLTLRDNIEMIKHIQIADHPGRNEPGTGEINYDFLFKYIQSIGYEGYIGCEYNPYNGTENGLKWLNK